MKNSIIRILQGALIGLNLSLVGYSVKTVVFWIAMVIMVLQWLKEQDNERI